MTRHATGGERRFEAGARLFEQGAAANVFYALREEGVELHSPADGRRAESAVASHGPDTTRSTTGKVSECPPIPA